LKWDAASSASEQQHVAMTRSTSLDTVEIVSDLGLRRSIRSTTELATLIALDMEQCAELELHPSTEGTENETSTMRSTPPLRVVCDDVRPAASSGIVCLVTKSRVQELRNCGKLPCPLCTRWCKGEKGLWWHRQVEHGAEHGEATEDASNAVDTLAMVVYDSSAGTIPLPRLGCHSTTPNNVTSGESSAVISDQDPFTHAKNGDLKCLIRSLEATSLDPATATDSNGSMCLHWAAGGGHLHVVEYLVKSLSCCPDAGQQGKRSFRNRTALHWAARNGHLDVVRYLVEECSTNIEAATLDGTTAFCWACWQGHLDCMKYLHSQGCDANSTNAFGCNSVLWTAQGEGGLDVIQWLSSIECDLDLVNSNGHGVLHKSAQRGKRTVIEWFVDLIESKGSRDCISDLSLIGPDLEGHCPSDLAGMEGHDDLAVWLAEREKFIALRAYHTSQKKQNGMHIPIWLEQGILEAQNASKLVVSSKALMNMWKAGAGVKRMSCHILSRQ